jgi:hypothetical protein
MWCATPRKPALGVSRRDCWRDATRADARRGLRGRARDHQITLRRPHCLAFSGRSRAAGLTHLPRSVWAFLTVASRSACAAPRWPWPGARVRLWTRPTGAHVSELSGPLRRACGRGLLASSFLLLLERCSAPPGGGCAGERSVPRLGPVAAPAAHLLDALWIARSRWLVASNVPHVCHVGCAQSLLARTHRRRWWDSCPAAGLVWLFRGFVFQASSAPSGSDACNSRSMDEKRGGPMSSPLSD